MYWKFSGIENVGSLFNVALSSMRYKKILVILKLLTIARLNSIRNSVSKILSEANIGGHLWRKLRGLTLIMIKIFGWGRTLIKFDKLKHVLNVSEFPIRSFRKIWQLGIHIIGWQKMSPPKTSENSLNVALFFRWI